MIKKLLSLLFVLFSSLTIASAQCADPSEYKVLLVGDSWAFFMGVDGTIDNVLSKWGHTDKKYLTNIDVAVNGARTTLFLENGTQNEIRDLINDNPSIEVVHLSIGGNDVLGQWDLSFTPSELQDLMDEVYTQTIDIISFLKTTKPGIKIVFSGYVYPNFEEVIETAAPFQTAHPFYSRWSGMGFPSFLQINTLLNDFSDMVETYAASDPQVEFFKIPGLMQYTFGQNTALGVAPGGSYAPFTQPMPFGDPSYPSPKNSMRDYGGITKDCFHLSPKGYRDLIGYHTKKFYQKFFMDDQYFLSDNSVDGSVSSQGQVTPLQVGLDQGESFGAILNFETQYMNWNTVEKAEFIQIKEITVDNPLNELLEIGIKSGNIGTSAMVEASDWTATLDATGTPCVFGDKNDAGAWLRIELPGNFMNYINKQSNTQIFIKSTNTVDGTISFTDASDPEFAPVLNLKYDDTYTPIKVVKEDVSVVVYPNPADNILRIESNELDFNQVKIYDALGRVVLSEDLLNTSVNIENLIPGLYKIVLENGTKMSTQSFIKK